MTAVAEQNMNGRRPPELVSVKGRELDGSAGAPGRRAANVELAQLRRVQWAVRATLTLGVAASVCANVLHARDELISQAIAAWPPLALLLTVELISRVPVYRRSLAVIRILATVAIAGIAAYVSYWHMAAVAARYGENGVAPYLLPLSVDGLIVVASVSLVELAGRVRTARDERPHDAGDTGSDQGGTGAPASGGGPSTVRPRAVVENQMPENHLSEPERADPTPTALSAAQPLPVQATAQSQIEQTNGTDKAGIAADLVMLLPAARAAQETLRRQGRGLSRDALAAQLRADGHTIATGRVSALLNVLRNEVSPGRANGGHPDLRGDTIA